MTKAKAMTFKAKATIPNAKAKTKKSENATAVIRLKRVTVYVAKHLKISSSSYSQMLVPCCPHISIALQNLLTYLLLLTSMITQSSLAEVMKYLPSSDGRCLGSAGYSL